MKRIAVDMDEVLADAVGKLIRLYNAEFSENLTNQDMWGHWMVDVLPPSRQDRLMGYLQEEDFFDDLNVMPDSQRVLERQRRRRSRERRSSQSGAPKVPTSLPVWPRPAGQVGHCRRSSNGSGRSTQ